MKRIVFLKKKITNYLKKEQIFKDDENKELEKSFLRKSRKNFSVANLLFKISNQDDMRKLLNLSYDFEMYDWVIIVSYYAMYTSALSALAKLGFKSKSHAATIVVLEYYYIPEIKNKKSNKREEKTKTLDYKDIHRLMKSHAMTEQLITKLLQTKSRRETAQYDATSTITKEMAKTSLEDADEFITKVEKILD